MSRVGKKLIPMPKGVKITVGDQLTVEGPKGKQTVPVPKGITFSEKDGVLTVIRDGDDKAAIEKTKRRIREARVVIDAVGAVTVQQRGTCAIGRKLLVIDQRNRNLRAVRRSGVDALGLVACRVIAT